MTYKVISGGQTGADQGGLAAAFDLNIPTGGYMPKNFQTEIGPRPDIAVKYNLTEMVFGSYSARTKRNVKESDMTIVFGNAGSRGSIVTIEACRSWGKPYEIFGVYKFASTQNDKLEELFIKILALKIEVINVAGNRESITKGIYQYTYDMMTLLLKGLEKFG